jgi:hypothetical protein
MAARTIPSLSIADHLTHACVTNSEEHGHGVFSWHDNEADAQHNAAATGGVCVPVSYVDGSPVTPHAATRVLRQRYGIG